MNMTTRSQTRLGTGVRLVDPVASGDAVRVPASSSVQSRGASAGPDLVDSHQDGESFFVDRGRGGPTGRAHRDHGGRPAQTQPVRGRPDHAFSQLGHAQSENSRRDRGPGRNGVERTRVGDDELPAAGPFLHDVPSLYARVQEGRGFEGPLPYVGRLHDFDARSPRPRASVANSAPSRPQGRGGISGVPPGTANGHKD